MKRGKRCYNEACLAAAPFASPSNPEVHACEIHKKRDFVNMRNKRCLAPGCYRNPHYGVSRLIDPNSKAQFCTKHKTPGMQNVNGGRCAGPDCSKQPRFSMPGEKGKYCSKHREEGMVDVLYTPCAADGCKKHPHFGHIEGGPRYCAQHRAEGMVDVKHRRCAVKSCRKDRVLIPGSANKRGKFCEVHCDVNELADKDVASSDGASMNDKKRSRAWVADMEDDRDYMSSEGSQLGSSMGDMTSNTPYDYPSARSSVRPSIHDAAQGLAHLAMLCAPPRERAPAYAGSGAGLPVSRGHDREDAYRQAPFQRSGHPETFRRGMARAAAARGPPHADYDHHAKSGSTRPPSYSGSKASAEPNHSYPLFKRDSEHPDASFEAGRPRMSPDLRRSSSDASFATGRPKLSPDLRRSASNSGGDGASPPTSTSMSTSDPSFRLRYSPEYSTYPYPWEFTREEKDARWAEASSVRRPMPVRGWNGHPSAT